MNRAQADVVVPDGVPADSVVIRPRNVEPRPLVAYSGTPGWLGPSVLIQVGERAFA
jgi:hypothetical protein